MIIRRGWDFFIEKDRITSIDDTPPHHTILRRFVLHFDSEKDLGPSLPKVFRCMIEGRYVIDYRLHDFSLHHPFVILTKGIAFSFFMNANTKEHCNFYFEGGERDVTGRLSYEIKIEQERDQR